MYIHVLYPALRSTRNCWWEVDLRGYVVLVFFVLVGVLSRCPSPCAFTLRVDGVVLCLVLCLVFLSPSPSPNPVSAQAPSSCICSPLPPSAINTSTPSLQIGSPHIRVNS